MEVLFASNNTTDWGNSPATNTTAANYDSARVPYAIEIPNSMNISMKSAHAAPSGDTVWYHWRAKFNSSMGTSQDGKIAVIKDANDEIIAELDLLNGKAAAKVYGDTTVTGSFAGVIGSGSILEFDLELVINGSGITLKYYLGQSLQSTATALNTGGLGVGRRFEFDQDDSRIFNMTEFMVAAEDTRNARVDRIDPSTAGNYSAWSGTTADLGDDDDGTSVFTDTAADRQSSNMDTYGSGDSIAAVVINCRASAGSGAPQTLKQTLRISSTDYDGAATTLTTGVENYIENFELDPSDSLAWDAAGVNACEVGLVSSA
jgi:hypothetical protein